ncbi:hypothetical protein B6U98_05095 [Thermoplasmatales archaeon ex4572_165]|nr:MAG: hypothetical protein B6U98_05095 [Thermoplasmatales archaeon ex4572_165]
MIRINRNILNASICIIVVIILFSGTLSACTGFTTSKGDEVFTGHNKDWWSTDTYIHVYPSDEETHARMFFEIPYPHIFNSEYKVLAGGINDQGLFYESYVTPLLFASFEFFKPLLFKSPVEYILEHFFTVQEVVDYIESHNLFFLNYILCSGQIFVIDKTGDSAIIEGDEIIRKQGDYQVCTNFLHSRPDLGGYPCYRYETATSILDNITDPSVSSLVSILNATHQKGYTQYSSICDLNNLTMYLYQFHNYEKGIKIDLNTEFQQDAHSYYFPSLFEPETNQAPDKPNTPMGPTSGVIDEQILFETNTTDIDNPSDEIYYKWNFGDDMQTNWVLNNERYMGKMTHSWSKSGSFSVTVKAKDIYGKESPWSDPLEVSISRFNDDFFTSFLQLRK